jgi:hypothetical protein
MDQSILAKIEQELAPAALPIFRLFTTPNFRKEWLLVTREMVCDHIGYAEGKDWQRNFINRVVEPNLEEGRQYQQIPADHPLVTAYFDSSELTSQTKSLKRGNAAKYYMITGDAFQDACMMAGTKQGKVVRGYFKDMADLAERFLREHAEQGDMLRDHVEKQSRELAQRALELEELRVKSVKAEKQFLLVHDDFVNRLMAKRGKIYIATNYRYGMDRLFKIGSTTTAPNRRLVGLNTGHPAGDNLMYVYIVDCDDVIEAERRLARYAKQMCDGKEFYKGDFQFLKAAVDISVCGVNEDYDMFTCEVRDCMHRYADDPFAGIAPEILQKMKPDPPRLEAPKEIVHYEPGPLPEYNTEDYHILINSAKDYFKATKPNYDWDRDAHNKFARIIWQDFKIYLKGRGIAAKDVNKMRMRFIDMCDKVKSLKVVLR